MNIYKGVTFFLQHHLLSSVVLACPSFFPLESSVDTYFHEITFALPSVLTLKTSF